MTVMLPNPMTGKPKLELTWIGKENRPKREPRILLEDPEKSYRAKHRVTDKDVFDNRLIFGNNLLALKALEAEFCGQGDAYSSIRPTLAAPSSITTTEWSIRSFCSAALKRCLYPVQKFDSDTTAPSRPALRRYGTNR